MPGLRAPPSHRGLAARAGEEVPPPGGLGGAGQGRPGHGRAGEIIILNFIFNVLYVGND